MSRPTAKLLGVILDAQLNMRAHVEKVTLAATKKCLAIGRLKMYAAEAKASIVQCYGDTYAGLCSISCGSPETARVAGIICEGWKASSDLERP